MSKQSHQLRGAELPGFGQGGGAAGHAPLPRFSNRYETGPPDDGAFRGVS